MWKGKREWDGEGGRTFSLLSFLLFVFLVFLRRGIIYNKLATTPYEWSALHEEVTDRLN